MKVKTLVLTGMSLTLGLTLPLMDTTTYAQESAPRRGAVAAPAQSSQPSRPPAKRRRARMITPVKDAPCDRPDCPGRLEGTITVTWDDDSKLAGLACGDLTVRVGTVEATTHHSVLPLRSTLIAHRAAEGDIASGKCTYSVPDLPSAKKLNYIVTVATAAKFPNCLNVKTGIDDLTQSRTFTLSPGETATNDLEVKLRCLQISTLAPSAITLLDGCQLNCHVGSRTQAARRPPRYISEW